MAKTIERATVFAPATVGNVGPGFDILGLAVEGLGDTVTAEVTDGPCTLVEITGRDSALVPREEDKNAAVIAARAILSQVGEERGVRLWLHKGLPLSGGLGGSAASSVGGALAASLALGYRVPLSQLLKAALEGEAAVAGHHLDNIAPCILGGLTLVRSADPPDIVQLTIQRDWWVALCTPEVRIETRAAREILPTTWERSDWLQQMANTAALVHAFATGDSDLVRRSLHDGYAEPRRASLIPRFAEVKAAALKAGAMGCSISGAGPTIFALCRYQDVAQNCLAAMQDAFGDIPSTGHVGPIARKGARLL